MFRKKRKNVDGSSQKKEQFSSPSIDTNINEDDYGGVGVSLLVGKRQIRSRHQKKSGLIHSTIRRSKENDKKLRAASGSKKSSTEIALSFHEEEEESPIEFKIRKGNVDMSAVINNATTKQQTEGEYSESRLQELRRNQAFVKTSLVSNQEEHKISDDQEVNDDNGEDESFIPLTSDYKTKKKKMKKRVAFAGVLSEEKSFSVCEDTPISDIEDDIAIQSWEAEQIRRGRHQASRVQNTAEPQNSKNVASISISNKSIYDTIEKDLNKLRETLCSEERALTRITNELSESTRLLEECHLEMTDKKNEYDFYLETRDYFTDLCHCMKTKITMIDELEKVVIKTRKEKENNRRRKRTLNMKSGLIPNYDIEKIYGDNCNVWNTTVNSAEEIDGTRLKNKTNQVVVLSKTLEKYIPDVSILEMDTVKDEEFDLSDEVEESSTHEKLRNAAGLLFEDVADEFVDIEYIISRFLLWKTRYPRSYESAYAQLSFAGIVKPIIEAEMSIWNPLKTTREDSNRSFDRFRWFQAFESNSDMKNESTMNSIMKDIVFTKVLIAVKEYWEPQRLSDCVCLKRLLMDVSRISSHLKQPMVELISNDLTAKLNDSVKEISIPPLLVLENESILTCLHRLWYSFHFQKCVFELVEYIGHEMASQFILFDVLDSMQIPCVQNFLGQFKDNSLSSIIFMEIFEFIEMVAGFVLEKGLYHSRFPERFSTIAVNVISSLNSKNLQISTTNIDRLIKFIENK